ncbi:MAG: SusC/RagA family TonB-linked outer membrane protein [Gemmatimonadetes bacterium]|nr:SusC/RagA family TonB-linked outer membrane protein [Gemmatimonadota bacterium]
MPVRQALSVSAALPHEIRLRRLTMRFVTSLGLAVLSILAPRPAMAQEGTVAGTVISGRTQEPVAGARVIVSGTPTVATTDVRGRFRLTSLPGTEVVLDIRVIGFRRMTVTARVGDQNVRVVIEEQAVTLDEMVVTGTAGAVEKRTVGNAVGQVQASFINERAPVTNVQQLLNSRVAGVVILPGSGNLGTGGVTRIRGVASLSLSNEPLLYIDGVRVNNDPAAGPNIRQGRQVSRINDINPEDIESIEVIKGPAAATLYGTEASSGVIQIITKRGVTGRPSVELTAKQGGTWLADAASKVPTVFSRNASGTIESVNLLESELAAGRPIFQTGRSQSYGASVRGGTDQIRYFLSGDYDRGEGVVDYNTLNKANTRANLNLTPSAKLDFSANIGFTTSRTRFAQAAAGWGIWDQLVWGAPSRLATRTRGFLRATPEAASEIESLAKVDRFIAGVQSTWRPLGWLSHRFSAGADVTDETNSILFPRHPDGSAYFFGALSLGQKTVERRRVHYYSLDYSANAELKLTSNIRSTTSAGVQYYTKRFETVSVQGSQFPAPPVTTVGGAAVTTGSEDIIENKTFGLFVQQQFGYKNRLFVTGALRGDDNSAFGQNYDFVVYPKVSASWVVSEEPFWRFKPVSTMKLRAAYGRAGQQPDVFAARRLYQPTTGPGDVSVLTPQAVGNPDLKPEQGQEIEVGFDAGLWNDRIGIGFTYFRQRRTDGIVLKRVPPSTGFPGFQFVNVGEVKNSGVEFELNTQVLTSRRFGWDLGFKVSTATNEVVSLGGVPPIVFGAQQQREGYPIGSFFERRIISADIDGAGQAINILCDPGPAGGAGVACATAPRVFYGRPTPKWEGAVSSTFTILGGLQIYGLVDFMGGFLIEHGDIEAMHTAFRNSKAIVDRKDPILLAYDRLGIAAPVGFFDAGFAKLREVSATYTLPAKLSRSFRVSRAAINIAARNVAYLWRAQREIYGEPIPDPEIRTPGAELSAYVQTVLPPFAQLITTIRLTF